MNSYLFVDDLDKLFCSTQDDQRIANIFWYNETLDLARIVGVKLPKQRLRESIIVGMIREHLQDGIKPRPCAGCVLSGRRWIAANEGRAINVSIDADSLDRAMPGASSIVGQLFQYYSDRYGLIFEQTSALPDFTMRADSIDGAGNTLGFALSYVSNDDDMDVGGHQFVSAELVMDTDEFWTPEFFFTVLAHELKHIFGVDHLPEELVQQGIRDLMAAFYAGPLTFDTFGQWSHNEMQRRYIGLPAFA